MNEWARFLAGLPGAAPFGPYDKLRQSPEWRAHAVALEEAFAAFRRVVAQPFSNWALGVSPGPGRERILFYPFSGPDFPFAHLLLPTADTYVLCGRERCGPLACEAVGGPTLGDRLARLREFVTHYLRRGFFVTRDMAESLDRYSDVGAAEALLMLAARQGFDVESAKGVALEGDGRLADDAAGEATTGLQLELRKGARRSRLFYFQHDLRDAYFSDRAPLARFVARQGPMVTLCKCASYLPHEPEFGNIRRFILSASSLLVQDASSVPFRLLNEQRWRVSLHGRYAPPLQVFERYEQHDLRLAYHEASATAEALDFQVGYGRAESAGGLIVARPPPGSRCGRAPQTGSSDRSISGSG